MAYGNGVSLEVRASYHLIMSQASLLYLVKCDESLLKELDFILCRPNSGSEASGEEQLRMLYSFLNMAFKVHMSALVYMQPH